MANRAEWKKRVGSREGQEARVLNLYVRGVARFTARGERCGWALSDQVDKWREESLVVRSYFQH
ncbi:hypothetical protein PENSUB_7786 [Penicillium subrubescens]|uniref:Uncharacterized protein n=1 Tax=Penicillium subrubescens TaxID=1316194 RepID=A0A1Q5TJD2_9EURO|nr:hypothetical protein PENSUB_7786 [Penicillium subrubescens]